MNKPNGIRIMQILYCLLADQEGVSFDYKIELDGEVVTGNTKDGYR